MIEQYTLSDYRNLLKMSHRVHLLVPGQKEKKY